MLACVPPRIQRSMTMHQQSPLPASCPARVPIPPSLTTATPKTTRSSTSCPVTPWLRTLPRPLSATLLCGYLHRPHRQLITRTHPSLQHRPASATPPRLCISSRMPLAFEEPPGPVAIASLKTIVSVRPPPKRHRAVYSTLDRCHGVSAAHHIVWSLPGVREESSH